MKTPIKSLTLVAASLLALSTSAKAVTSTQYATNLSLVPYTDYNYSLFRSFDMSKGTLNSVTISIDSTLVGGSLRFNQGSSGNSSVSGFQADVTVYGTLDNGLSTDIVSDLTALNVSSPSLPKSVARNNSQTFTFDNNQQIILANASRTLTSFYDMSGYVGNGVTYAPTFTLNLGINTNGSIQGSPTYNYSGVTSAANISLTYDYTPTSPVPEPSTYGIALGSLALVAGVVARRRKLKS